MIIKRQPKLRLTKSNHNLRKCKWLPQLISWSTPLNLVELPYSLKQSKPLNRSPTFGEVYAPSLVANLVEFIA